MFPSVVEFEFDGFSLDMCRGLVAMFDVSFVHQSIYHYTAVQSLMILLQDRVCYTKCMIADNYVVLPLP